MKYHIVIGILIAASLSGCVKHEKLQPRELNVNALDTIAPQRSKEQIMRGVIMPYLANNVMHDSSFVYIVAKEADWMVEDSTRIIDKSVLGSINGI